MKPQPQDLPPERRFREYEDHHYHDEDEVSGVPLDQPARRSPPRRRPVPKFPKRRYPEDD